MPKTAESRYWQRVNDAADAIGTDGCSFVGPAFRDCCKRHDLEYRTGKTIDGGLVSKHEADRRFLACMQSRSIFGWYTPMGWIRYWAVSRWGRPSA